MSAPMIAWLPFVHRIQKYFTSEESTPASQIIRIPSIEIHDVEKASELRARTLKYLLKLNHSELAIFFHNLQFDNHMAHILCSAYVLGATSDHLHTIYEEESKSLEKWTPSPQEVTKDDWRKFLGDRRYQRAYLDFFEDELAISHDYKWKDVVSEYLFEGEHPLINCAISALGHPLIHLGYAFEFTSKEVGLEAVAQIASAYNDYHKYIDDPSYTRTASYSSTSPLDLLHKIHEDKRLDGLFRSPGASNIDNLLDKHEDLVLNYWNAWKLDDPKQQFQDSQEAAVSLLVATVAPDTHAYDFFLVHLLTTSHAVRTLLPLIPDKFHISLVRQWWLITIMVYIAQLRPKIDPEAIGRPDLKGKHWGYVIEKATAGPWSTDPHYVKALRSMKEAAMTWGDVHEWYLTAAVRFADEFQGWTGFGNRDTSEVEYRQQKLDEAKKMKR